MDAQHNWNTGKCNFALLGESGLVRFYAKVMLLGESQFYSYTQNMLLCEKGQAQLHLKCAVGENPLSHNQPIVNHLTTDDHYS